MDWSAIAIAERVHKREIWARDILVTPTEIDRPASTVFPYFSAQDNYKRKSTLTT
jgi:hypothetical protein